MQALAIPVYWNFKHDRAYCMEVLINLEEKERLIILPPNHTIHTSNRLGILHSSMTCGKTYILLPSVNFLHANNE